MWMMRLFFLLLMTACSSQASPADKQCAYKGKGKQKQQKQHLSVAKPQIVIDPGHGGFDLGAHSRVCEEKEVCLKTAERVKKHLLQRGYRVIMTRTRDEFVPLKKRAQIANLSQSQLLVSIHYNAAKSEEASGAEVFYYDHGESWRVQKSKQAAQLVLSNIISNTGTNSRGVKGGNFCVIRETKMPSILVEGGFLTNPAERTKLCDSKYIDKLALAVVEGIDQYFKKGQ
ncbi:MAG: N-acetylmuramoyl-L-alanine amidase [Chlamydiae bacterium]|nr:N-acetylmuramoyl-L-alanine amidase [Chlamydiota bacterium]